MALALSASESKSVFSRRLVEYELESVAAVFEQKGWTTYSDFAFCTSSFREPDTTVFDEQVLKVLFGGTAVHPLAGRVRKLFLESWAIATEEMKNVTRPVDGPRPPMHPEDRRLGTERVRKLVQPVFEMIGEDEPATCLIDACFSILQRDVARYIRWEECISRRAQTRDPSWHEDPSLQLMEGGIFKAVRPTSPTADVSEDLRWLDAMQRRGCALDIAGVLDFHVHARWIAVLRKAYNAQPEPGYRRVSWAQLLQADRALWDYIEDNCPRGPRKRPGETITEFQRFFAEGITARRVERILDQREAGSSGTGGARSSGLSAASASATQAPPPPQDVGSLKRKLENVQKELANTKKKVQSMKGGANPDRGGVQPNGRPRNERKGDGKGGDRTLPAKHLRRPGSDARKRICFPFNSANGCSKCGPGEECSLGLHVCLLCAPDVAHSAADPVCPKCRTWR